MNQLLTLVKKDLCLEFRSLESIVLVIALSCVLSTVVALGVNTALLPPAGVKKIFPALLWIVFLFASTIAISRSFEIEERDRAFEGTLLCGISPASMYVSKVVVQTLFVAVGLLLSFLLIALLLDLRIVSLLPVFLPVFLLAVLGYNALSVIVAAMASGSRLKAMLVPVILLPLLFPLFFCGIELTYEVMRQEVFDYSSLWLSVMFGLDVLYIALGINLYEYVICE